MFVGVAVGLLVAVGEPVGVKVGVNVGVEFGLGVEGLLLQAKGIPAKTNKAKSAKDNFMVYLTVDLLKRRKSRLPSHALENEYIVLLDDKGRRQACTGSVYASSSWRT